MFDFQRSLLTTWFASDYQIRDPIIIALVLLLIEILIWRRKIADILKTGLPPSFRINLSIYAFNFLVMTMPLSMLAAFSFGLARHYNLVLIKQARFEMLPDWAVAMCALIFGDMIAYWAHRFQHSRFLWRIHALHHSDERVSWFTTWRIHPLDRIYGVAVGLTLFGLIGFPLWSVVFAGFAFHYYAYFLHANVPWKFSGVFARILVSPAQHRWHHSTREKGYCANFAGMFAWIDIVFGTYYCPDTCTEPTGVSGEPTTFLRLMLEPLLPSPKTVDQVFRPIRRAGRRLID